MYRSDAAICWFASGQLPWSLSRSLHPSCRNTRTGFGGVLRISPGYTSPPRMLVKLPTDESTFENRSGRSHAAVNAQMPPELAPQIARPAGSARNFTDFATSGRISCSRNRAYWSEGVSYSKLRFVRQSFSSLPGVGNLPGLTNTPTVTGMWVLWIRLSNTTGTRDWPFSLTYPPPSWNTIRHGGDAGSYCAGTYTQQSRSVPG